MNVRLLILTIAGLRTRWFWQQAQLFVVPNHLRRHAGGTRCFADVHHDLVPLAPMRWEHSRPSHYGKVKAKPLSWLIASKPLDLPKMGRSRVGYRKPTGELNGHL